MSRAKWILIVTFLLATAPLQMGGCPPGDPYPCPGIQVTTRQPTLVELDLNWVDGVGNILISTEESELPFSSMRVEGLGTFDQTTEETWLIEWVIGQFDSEFGALQIDFKLPDPRDWTVGELVMPTEVRFQYTEPCADTDTACPRCTAMVERDLALSVLDTVGGSSPWPEVVDDEFLREYRVEFELGEPVRGEGCQHGYTGSFAAEYRLSERDILPLPERTCDSYSTLGVRETIAREFNEQSR